MLQGLDTPRTGWHVSMSLFEDEKAGVDQTYITDHSDVDHAPLQPTMNGLSVAVCRTFSVRCLGEEEFFCWHYGRLGLVRQYVGVNQPSNVHKRTK